MNRADQVDDVVGRLRACRERMRVLVAAQLEPGRPPPMLPKPTTAAAPPRPWQDREPEGSQ